MEYLHFICTFGNHIILKITALNGMKRIKRSLWNSYFSPVCEEGTMRSSEG